MDPRVSVAHKALLRKERQLALLKYELARTSKDSICRCYIQRGSILCGQILDLQRTIGVAQTETNDHLLRD